ncbi:hypothetical protein AXG93_1175s1310 [Marchantia polymorpha subsp. ruderalis]|uniref:Uncharacterized protein n=1 Tax=Marchantia polymorpha subsp. ruderalis TaxID=1480154 RepID=A0A176VPB6_MARPO|nr:hypothetical protein AXG93_1175s1310 [Marchantia polymorpha subsp. ruderalis]
MPVNVAPRNYTEPEQAHTGWGQRDYAAAMECVGLSARTAVGGGQLVQPPVPVLLDDASRLRVLHPDLHANSRVVEKTCNLFRSKLLQFHSVRFGALYPVIVSIA